MGVCDSPPLASGLSAIVCEVVVLRTAAFADSYVDDIVNAAPAGIAQARRNQATVREVMAAANIPESIEKADIGTRVTILGRVVDTVEGTVSLPRKSVHAYMVHAHVVQRILSSDNPRLRATVTAANMSSLSGKLGW